MSDSACTIRVCSACASRRARDGLVELYDYKSAKKNGQAQPLKRRSSNPNLIRQMTQGLRNSGVDLVQAGQGMDEEDWRGKLMRWTGRLLTGQKESKHDDYENFITQLVRDYPMLCRDLFVELDLDPCAIRISNRTPCLTAGLLLAWPPLLGRCRRLQTAPDGCRLSASTVAVALQV